MQLIHYGRAELKESEHRPIVAMFEAQVRTINHQTKAKIEEAITKKIS